MRAAIADFYTRQRRFILSGQVSAGAAVIGLLFVGWFGARFCWRYVGLVFVFLGNFFVGSG